MSSGQRQIHGSSGSTRSSTAALRRPDTFPVPGGGGRHAVCFNDRTVGHDRHCSRHPHLSELPYPAAAYTYQSWCRAGRPVQVLTHHPGRDDIGLVRPPAAASSRLPRSAHPAPPRPSPPWRPHPHHAKSPEPPTCASAFNRSFCAGPSADLASTNIAPKGDESDVAGKP